MKYKAIHSPIVVTTVRRRKDKSISFNAETPEVTDEEALVFMSLQGVNSVALIQPSDEPELEVIEVDGDLQTKTLSQRLRAVLYVLLEKRLRRKPTQQEWNQFYTNQMEASIQKLKGKIEEFDMPIEPDES